MRKTAHTFSHPALARLPHFETRDAAKALFYADGLIRYGLEPGRLMRAYGIETSQLDLLKFIPHYNPEEPRVPAGHHLESGRWTEDGEDDSSTDTEAGHPSEPHIELVSSDWRNLPVNLV